MVSGYRGKSTLAHILPHSAQQNSSVMELLQLTNEDLNSDRNLLLLANNIEYYFDRLKLSFVPHLGAGMKLQWILKIWDDSIRDKPLADGADEPIGSCEGKPLILHEDHIVYKRCLSYQAFWAAAKHLGGTFTEESIPYDFSSLDEPHIKKFMSVMKTMQSELFHTINQEVDD
jgi:hypothetical protein